MIWIIYNIAFAIGYVLLLPRFLARMWRRGGYGRGFWQRFGCYPPAVREACRARPRVWVHAVSVGETFVALTFMQAVRARRPDTAFILTVNTSTAHALAAQRKAPDDLLLYFPIDFPPLVHRALEALRPLALVLVECELWPNLIRQAHARGARLMLLNGRVSDRSFRRYGWVRPLVRRILALFDVVCAQSVTDAQRLAALGADPARVRLTGTAKYDLTALAAQPDVRLRAALARAGFTVEAGLLVGGSTWPGEEDALLDTYLALRRAHPEARLVLVPRHVERARDVIAAITRRGLSYVRRSALESGAPPTAPAVLLVDTTGELQQCYGVARVIFVGKSLTARGGQNIIEAAAWARPIVIGPHLENFAAVLEDFRAADALRQVRDAFDLQRTILALWADEATRAQLGRRARAVVEDHTGALAASADALVRLLATTDRSQPAATSP